MVTLTPEDRAEISRVVATCEQATRAELVCVIGERSAEYEEVPLALAALAALLVPLVMLVVNVSASDWRAAHVAASRQDPGLEWIVLWQGVVFAAVWMLAAIRPVRMRLAPGALKRERVRRRALEQFSARNLSGTSGRTGVLIYVSLDEHMAELLADQGVSEKVRPDVWQGPMKSLTSALKRGDLKGGLIAAVSEAGAILAEAAPIAAGDLNELPNDVVQLPPT